MARPPSAASILKKEKKQRFEPKTPIATDMFLPNQSGDHSAGRVRTTPTTDYELVNKKFLDDNYYDGSEFTTGSILFSDGNDIQQDNTNFFWDDTNKRLGIGTASPGYPLEVNGNSYFDGNVGVGIVPSAITRLAVDKVAEITDNANYIGTKFSQQLHKTSAPFTGQVNGAVFDTRLPSANTQNWTSIYSGMRGGTVYTATLAGSSGNVDGMAGFVISSDFNATGATITDYTGLKIQVPQSTPGKATNAYGLYIEDYNGATALNYSIYSEGGDNYFGGDVGIGTTSPLTTLHIKGTDANQLLHIQRQSTTATAVAGISFGITTNDAVRQAGIDAIRVDGSNAHLAFRTSASEKMRIEAGGNVGIGTPIPKHLLDVNGIGLMRSPQPAAGSESYNNLRVGTEGTWTIAGSDYSTGIIMGRTDHATRNVGIRAFLDGSFGQNPNLIFDVERDEKMRIDAAGNVGIGVTPTQKLDVNAKAGMSALGGHIIKLTNKTGANSVQGEVVRTDSANDDAVILALTAEVHPIGVFLESGVSDGSEAWIVVGGIADVKADTAGFTRGDRLVTSITAATVGRATANNAPSVAVHFQEIGHAVESAAGNALGRAVIHFL